MAKPDTSGNYISEWFGQRIYPDVRIDVDAVSGSQAGICPFLTDVLRSKSSCVKNYNSSGVCTISSSSNGSRQDWLVCPYRVIDSEIVRKSCQRIFGLSHEVVPLPVSILKNDGALKQFTEEIRNQGRGYLFFQDKLGGEISLTGSMRSPELSFDVTLVEICQDDQGGFTVARYGILEIQTMDYHGSYKGAVNNLRDGLRLHGHKFPSALEENLKKWTGDGIESPNVANVFKRTFYQMMLKFRLSGKGTGAAGTILALPRSVWDSWQPFLGAPELEKESKEVMRLRTIAGSVQEDNLNSFICVFDLDGSSKCSTSPVKIEYFIRVSPERLTHHAFTVVPENILQSIRTDDSVMSRIRVRLGEWWPAFKPTARKRVT